MKFLVFAGTTEGKAVIRMLAEKNLSAEAFVATEYGQEVLEQEFLEHNSLSDKLTIHSSRLNLEQMEALFKAQDESCIVVDATHPYAKDVTMNLKTASKEAGLEYIRVLRKSGISKKLRAEALNAGIELIEFKSPKDVVAWANQSENKFKKLLLTTGSKDLDIYTNIEAYNQRVYIRILPDMPSLQKAIDLGYKKSNIVCMQGPFSTKLNEELIKALNVDILITKDTGKAGGFEEKLQSAVNQKINVGIIRRPEDENGELIDNSGLELEEFKAFLEKENYPRFPMFLDINAKKVVVVGGGQIAQRRIETLLKYGAKIVLIAPEQTEALQKLSTEKKITLYERPYIEGDLKGAFIAVAATDSNAVNQAVYEEAKELEIHISVADDRRKCSFYFPAVIQHGNISIGLVSDGSDHKKTAETAKRLRGYLQLEK